MAKDISLAVGDGARRMTYAELADVRGISLSSARRLVLRHHWPRQVGNDGHVRMTVPLAALAKAAAPAGFLVTVTPEPVSHPTDPTTPATVTTSSPPTDTMTAQGFAECVAALREQLAIANARAERAELVIDHLRDRIDALLALWIERRAWWRRWFR
jgi:hypothetical protein